MDPVGDGRVPRRATPPRAGRSTPTSRCACRAVTGATSSGRAHPRVTSRPPRGSAVSTRSPSCVASRTCSSANACDRGRGRRRWGCRRRGRGRASRPMAVRCSCSNGRSSTPTASAGRGWCRGASRPPGAGSGRRRAGRARSVVHDDPGGVRRARGDRRRAAAGAQPRRGAARRARARGGGPPRAAPGPGRRRDRRRRSRRSWCRARGGVFRSGARGALHARRCAPSGPPAPGGRCRRQGVGGPTRVGRRAVRHHSDHDAHRHARRRRRRVGPGRGHDRRARREPAVRIPSCRCGAALRGPDDRRRAPERAGTLPSDARRVPHGQPAPRRGVGGHAADRSRAPRSR